MISHILSLYKIKFQIDYILVCNVGIFRDTKKLKLTGFLKTVGRFQVDFYSQTSSRVASFSATEDPVRRLGTTCLASEDKPAVHATEKTRQR